MEDYKEYPDHNDPHYEGIWEIKSLFYEINEDYYEPVKTKIAFKGNYIEYETRGDKGKNLSPEEYLDMIRPHLRDMINNHKAPLEGYLGNDNNLHGEWKIQLTRQINFASSLDPGEIRTMDSKSKNIEILIGSETDYIINKLFELFLQKYQEGLEEKMRDSKFVFERIDLLYYSLHKTNIKRKGESYIESPKWLRNKGATINPINKNDNNCFQYAITTALNYQNIENNPEKISNIKPFIDQYNWRDIDFPPHQKDWKKFEQNNKTIALNILFVPHNTKVIAIRLAYKSKHNRESENQVV